MDQGIEDIELVTSCLGSLHSEQREFERLESDFIQTVGKKPFSTSIQSPSLVKHACLVFCWIIADTVVQLSFYLEPCSPLFCYHKGY